MVRGNRSGKLQKAKTKGNGKLQKVKIKGSSKL